MQTIVDPSRVNAGQPMLEEQQIAAALKPSVIGPLLHKAFQIAPGVPCRIMDTKYEPGDYCMVLYRLGDQTVIGSFRWGEEESGEVPVTGGAGTVQVLEPIGLRVYRFPNDPALPGLHRALDPSSLAEALSQALPEVRDGSARILSCRMKVLRFRPAKRCTVRIDFWLRSGQAGLIEHRVMYGKIYHNLEKAAYVNQEMQQLSRAFPQGNDRIGLAGAAAFLPDLSMVLQDPVEGVALEDYIDGMAASCDPRGVEGITRAAGALAALHTSGLVVGRERPIDKELVRFKKRAVKISRVNPQLAEDMTNLATKLQTWLDALPGWGAENTVVHGDCKPGQFFVNGGPAALLDFDHCGMADPAGDVGTFLATLEQMVIQHTVKGKGQIPPCARWAPELKRGFLDEYVRSAGYSEAFRLRARWYEAVGLLRKAIRAFERSPYSPLPAALVDGAWRILADLPEEGRANV